MKDCPQASPPVHSRHTGDDDAAYVKKLRGPKGGPGDTRPRLGYDVPMRYAKAGVGLGMVVLACGGSAPVATPPPSADASLAPDPFVQKLAGKRVLWVGAHPDDESTIAPVLGEACVDGGATCTFLVATRGEHGSCARPDNCLPDLPTTRIAEMQAAAKLYGGAVVQWDLADSPGPTTNEVADAWALASGGAEALIAKMKSAIEAAAPDVVVTFDPRHGTTCHPDHRVVAALALTALQRIGPTAPPAWISEVRLDIAANGSTIGYLPAIADDPKLVTYDATRSSAGAKGQTWEYLLANLRVHASQFTPAQVTAFAAAAPAERRAFFLSYEEATAAKDPRYDVLCN